MLDITSISNFEVITISSAIERGDDSFSAASMQLTTCCQTWSSMNLYIDYLHTPCEIPPLNIDYYLRGWSSCYVKMDFSFICRDKWQTKCYSQLIFLFTALFNLLQHLLFFKRKNKQSGNLYGRQKITKIWRHIKKNVELYLDKGFSSGFWQYKFCNTVLLFHNFKKPNMSISILYITYVTTKHLQKY